MKNYNMRLKARIMESDLRTQEAVADACGLHWITIYNLLYKKTNGRLTTWRRIADCLGCEIGDILPDDWGICPGIAEKHSAKG